MGTDKLWESKRRIEEINSTTQPPSIRYRRTSGPKFEDRHRRVTTYLENDIFGEVELLRDHGEILNLTAFFNDAVRAYLKENFGKGS